MFFVVRAVRPAIYGHYHQDEPIRAWMNIGFPLIDARLDTHLAADQQAADKSTLCGLTHRPPKQ